ncbi:hypothetical protein HN592_01735 [Candidatus Woesearchaeota archaeon]|jgi:hypothetical protein|nr:hypothetical protein [Candidatus Woesearchaeota archaeon]MBT4368597.1 hypothetical protein [Candidatus Woesearchaeota archaeon]MBT4713094.1 hypothetical protein [Candidatus Woesearchaeota archaeon]MBT6639016.1 hypothetical protein [Candidatus Woesearchaeota archaeon]MBT7134215.1 hypothetical protein [Candidatus Woesearchaeota archaeon]
MIEEKDGKKVISFGKKKETPKKAPTFSPTEGRALRAVKVIEERLSNLDRKTELIENNILSINKRQNVELKTINSKMMELEKEIGLIKRRIVEMAADLKNFARREEVDTLRKYLDAWNPINFATHNEVEEIIKEKSQGLNSPNSRR